ncbi:DUF427 domain-containing protein [Aeromicrobium chenweiae]|uniref:Uncharacterized protein n=1 Tax=Aeromicrobium chenweiae TaxID=2079793 RepID=A0A2S0WKV9_9ACTN|nr:DUF427 domain-containing protein [Aeromicrobium chenweiae]AWB91975.1 hypothetical protein C3E78_07065 [Aeromicrobium chenweiae]TGN32826.1 DUF427 domain-containing protein [Aeromicrobium chenweiae]
MIASRPVENVWDYPRPPSIEPSDENIIVELGGMRIAWTSTTFRICETSHPPTYYLPMDAFAAGVLRPVRGATWCEWKGAASYFDVVTPERTVAAGAWTYRTPSPGYADIVGHVGIYPGPMDRCLVDGEVVHAQEGDLYGGWITSRVSGPFKGGPGTFGW